MSGHPAGEPALSVAAPDGPTRAVVLVLHGGRVKSTAPARDRQLAVLRMAPIAANLQAAGSGHGLAVARLRFLVRGWNGADRSPVHDAVWAVDRLTRRFPGVPVALVGHSMGGRTAVFAAAQPAVTSVVLLAPWIEPDDPVATMTDRRLLTVHGDRDHITRHSESERYTREAAEVAASASFVTVARGRHAMLARAGLWHGLTTGFVLATTCDAPPAGTVDPGAANVLSKVLAGQESVRT